MNIILFYDVLLMKVFYVTAKSYILLGRSGGVRPGVDESDRRGPHRHVRPGYDLDGLAAEPDRARTLPAHGEHTSRI